MSGSCIRVTELSLLNRISASTLARTSSLVPRDYVVYTSSHEGKNKLHKVMPRHTDTRT